MNKLFDHVILYLFKDQFQSSDMQFGYKDTLQRCVLWFIKKLFLIMLTIIQVYNYSCLLDASKAFDRVHLGKLLTYCYIKISPQQSLDYILTVIPDKRLVLVGTILCLNISLCQTE